MDETVEKGAGRDHKGPAVETATVLQRQAATRRAVKQNPSGAADNPVDVRLSLERRAHHFPYRALSACARGDHTAGPRLRLSSLNWMPVASMARPMRPPSASISRTRWPLAVPPTAGLHGIWATVSRENVHKPTLQPNFAAAQAASTPACPEPTTMTSNSLIV